jgi:hypothetical protein
VGNKKFLYLYKVRDRYLGEYVVLKVEADPEELIGSLEAWLALVAVGVVPDLITLLLHSVGSVDDVGRWHDPPGGDDVGHYLEDADHDRMRLYLFSNLIEHGDSISPDFIS